MLKLLLKKKHYREVQVDKKN